MPTGPWQAGCRFNPRAPRGARPDGLLNQSNQVSVSIHAPREGRDTTRGTSPPARRGFNPRAPRGARRSGKSRQSTVLGFNPRAPRGARRHSRQNALIGRLFQSTRPARGATRTRSLSWPYDHVSIHAPREGRDPANSSFINDLRMFQSTRPARGATGSPSITISDDQGFNPRAPRGARPGQIFRSRIRQSFNPRAPRGARPCISSHTAKCWGFQSTRPARGATPF